MKLSPTRTFAPIIAALLAMPAAQAATTIDAAHWQKLAPTLQAALECRADPDTAATALAGLSGTDEPIKPPVPFTVFGLHVRSVSVYIDPDGELGASYTAQLSANAAAVRTASKLGRKPERDTSMGVLSIAQDGSAQLTCLVQGGYDERGYQEP
ncbi:hypothetical protein [uncultured Stenotrophomonas sp.]|uniref:hypothetical protein n=1 Tax=uncultured Stenotrophomonas sp. TaxID=165438 RepID=UPI0025F380F6|nr:hypothetical protein [uncultured Stenotrophomonas sp.]